MNFGIPVTYRWVHTEVKAGLCVVRVSRERLGRMWPPGGACGASCGVIGVYGRPPHSSCKEFESVLNADRHMNAEPLTSMKGEYGSIGIHVCRSHDSHNGEIIRWLQDTQSL